MRLNKYYDKIQAIYDSLDELICELEAKQYAIECIAYEHDRDMTESEQERYDKLDDQLDVIHDCMCSLEGAMFDIESYCI